jgi:hypothetical protein
MYIKYFTVRIIIVLFFTVYGVQQYISQNNEERRPRLVIFNALLRTRCKHGVRGVAQLTETLRYKLEGREFDSR